MREIYLAGGCFWGTEAYFGEITGVASTSVGYANGDSDTATYQTIAQTNHAETVRVEYNPAVVGLPFLLDMYYKIIDPCSVNKQGADVGTQYRTGIYYTDAADLPIITASLDALAQTLNGEIAVEVAPLTHYVLAEEYHQDYLHKNPNGYCHIGHTAIAAAAQAAPTPDLRETLTPLQYEVTQNAATEPPYQNEYWDFYQDGIYLDITTGEPLFSSTDKFPCHAGWAAFSKPIAAHLLTEHEDLSLGRQRTEVKSTGGNAHLGHVFEDGPAALGGLRYCINSAALKFVPKENLAEEGFAEFLPLFETD